MTEGKGTRNNLLICLVFVVLLLVIDQVTKIWVKTTMIEGEMHEITSWFKIYFVENEGMAYGITIGSKLLLTLFRILAMSAGLYFLIRIIRTGRFSLPFYHCLFYGEVFTSSHGSVAQLVSWGQGYGDFLQGKVVDMLYFPIIRTTYPSWSPIHAGEPFIFFSPIFNFADSCITTGVLALLLFYRKTCTTALELLQKKKHSSSTPPEA